MLEEGMAGGRVGAGVAAAAAAAKAWRRGGQGVVNWFPGHMAKATREIRDTLRRVDLVVEVRDARIPLSSANEQLSDMISHKRRLVVLNKMDLGNQNLQQRWAQYFETQGLRHLFVNAHHQKSLGQLLNTVQSILTEERAKEDSLMVMVIGIPNVGKSAIINGIYRLSTGQSAQGKRQSTQGKAPLKTAKIGPLPGVTREVACFKVGEAPSTYIMDTPGVMVPNVKEATVGLKLALTGAVKDSVVGEERLARYLLRVLNLCGGGGILKGSQRNRIASPQNDHPDPGFVGENQPQPSQAPSGNSWSPGSSPVFGEMTDGGSPQSEIGVSLQSQNNKSQAGRRSVGVRDKEPPVPGSDTASRSAAAISEVLAMPSEELNLVGDTFPQSEPVVEEEEEAFERRIDMQMKLLRRRFKVPMEKGDSGWEVVGRRILQAYRAGNLGKYTLDVVPD